LLSPWEVDRLGAGWEAQLQSDALNRVPPESPRPRPDSALNVGALRSLLERTGRNSQELAESSRPAPVAPDSLEGIGTKDSQLPAAIVNNTLFLERFQRSVRALAAHAGESSKIGLRKGNLELDGSVANSADEIREIQQPARQPSRKLAARSLESSVDDPASPLSESSGQLETCGRIALEQLREEVRVETQNGSSHHRHCVERLCQAAECGDIADYVSGEAQAQDRFAPLHVACCQLDDAGANEMNPIHPVPGEIEPFTRNQ
jgi:hypothetical protein